MENMSVTIWMTFISPELPPLPEPVIIMEDRSKPVLWISRGYSERVSSSIFWI